MKAATHYLSYLPPFDWRFFCRYFETRSTPGVELSANGRYIRTIAINGARGILEVEHQDHARQLAVTLKGPVVSQADEILPRVSRMFDLTADMDAIHRGLSVDK